MDVCASVGHVSRLWNDAIPVVKIVKGHIGNEQDERRNEESRLDKSRLLAGMKREVCGISIRGYSSRIYQFITKGRLIESG